MISRLCGMATALGSIHGPADVVLVDNAPGDAYQPGTVDRRDVRARQADQGGGDFQPGRALGLVDRAGNGLCSRTQVHHHAFFNPLRRLDAHSQDP